MALAEAQAMLSIWLTQLSDSLVRWVDIGVHHAVENLPQLENAILELLDLLFAPRLILRQIATIGGIQVTLMIFSWSYTIFGDVVRMLTKSGREERKLMKELNTAKSYLEWKEIAKSLDRLRGFDQWLEEEESSLYDVRMIKKRIASVEEMLERGDVFNLVFRLRGCLSRDQFGMQHEGLYSRALSGTKLILEKYHETMSMALNFICDSPIAEEEIPDDAKLAFFNETRHAYGRTALLLSGGAYLGYYHAGVAHALHLQGLLPRVISGASAGSIITGIIGTRTDHELKELFGKEGDNNLEALSKLRTDFFRFSEELKSENARKLHYLVPQGLRWITFPIFSSIFEKKILNLDTEHFKKALMEDIGLFTFQEAFDRTGRIINITVAPLNNYEPPRLLNYLTAPHVCVWSAAAASCALPGIFDSVTLIVREPNGEFRPENEWTRQSIPDKEDLRAAHLSSYSDGSLESDLPMQQLSELFNINHFIVSQVNPHSAILSAFSQKATIWSNPLYGALVGYMRFLTAQCRDWLKNIVNLLVFRSKAPVWSARRGFTQTLTQDYEGREVDVTIMPWAGHISAFTALTSAIKNPNPAEFAEVVKVGECNTWPAISRVRAQCLIEMTLDKCVQRLRKRISDDSELQRQRALIAAQRQQKLGLGLGPREYERLLVEGKGTIDRTPSFYTSRSIVNLSGLSVADPPPHQSSYSSPGRVSKGNLMEGTDEEQDFLTLNVIGGEVPTSSGFGHQQLHQSQLTDPHSSEFRKNYSNDSLKDKEENNVIHKTTNMANYYYKKTQSEDKIAEMNQQQLQQQG